MLITRISGCKDKAFLLNYKRLTCLYMLNIVICGHKKVRMAFEEKDPNELLQLLLSIKIFAFLFFLY